MNYLDPFLKAQSKYGEKPKKKLGKTLGGKRRNEKCLCGCGRKLKSCMGKKTIILKDNNSSTSSSESKSE